MKGSLKTFRLPYYTHKRFAFGIALVSVLCLMMYAMPAAEQWVRGKMGISRAGYYGLLFSAICFYVLLTVLLKASKIIPLPPDDTRPADVPAGFFRGRRKSFLEEFDEEIREQSRSRHTTASRRG